jgi:hypothetical protein
MEMHQIDPAHDDEMIIRATLHLEGNRLNIATSSQARMDRVLTDLLSHVRDCTVVSDERQPLHPGQVPAALSHGPMASVNASEMEPASAEIQDFIESRWCDEAVPALAGLTPRQAANDPTRRETLDRLLREFEAAEQHVPAGAITMRSKRLRELLNL